MNLSDFNGKTIADILKVYGDASKYIIVNPDVVKVEPSPFFKVYAVEMRFTGDDWQNTSGSFSLTRPGLFRLMAAMNISIVNTMRTDDGMQPNYASVTVVGAQRMPDGTTRTMVGTKSLQIDALIEETFKGYQSKRAKGWDKFKGQSDETFRAWAEGQRATLQRFRGERAETGAIERMIRGMAGMKTGWKEEDTKKVFVVFVTAPNMDALMMDPAIRQMAAAQALGGIAALYPMQQQQQLANLAPPPAGAFQITDGTTGDDATDEPPVTVIVPPQQPQTQQTHAQGGQVNTAVLLDQIERLIEERQHGLTEGQIKDLRNASPERMQQGIDYLKSRPAKPAPVAQEQMPWDVPPPPIPMDGPPMDSDGPPMDGPPSGGAPKFPSEKQLNRLLKIGSINGYDSAALHELIAKLYNGITSFNDLTRDQYNSLCGDTQRNIPSYLENNKRGASSNGNDDLPF